MAKNMVSEPRLSPLKSLLYHLLKHVNLDKPLKFLVPQNPVKIGVTIYFK